MHAPRPTRRTTLVTAAVVWPLLAACDIDPPRARTDARQATPQPSGDVALVDQVVSALTEAVDVLVAASAAVPKLTNTLQPVRTDHEAHRTLLVEALPEAPESTDSPAGVPASRKAALAAVRRSERQLQRQVEVACLKTANGDLARLFASIAVSTGQHLLALPAGRAS